MDSLLEIIDGIIWGHSHTKNVNSAGPRTSLTHHAVALAAEESLPRGQERRCRLGQGTRGPKAGPLRALALQCAFPHRGSEPYLNIPASVTIFLGEVSFPHLPPPAV